MSIRSRALALACALALAACTGDPDPSSTETEPNRPPTARLIGQNLELLPGDDLAARIGFEPLDDAAHIIVTMRPETARVSACPLSSIDDPLPPITSCRRDIASGVREPVRSPGLRAIALVATGTDALRADLRLEFGERGRAIDIVLPRVRAPVSPGCEDNACNPFFELVPPVGGAFSARASWRGPDATLLLLQGSVLGRARTATGLPYGEPARADGPSPLAIETTLGAPAEYALVLRHRALRPGEPPLENVSIQIRWPGLKSS